MLSIIIQLLAYYLTVHYLREINNIYFYIYIINVDPNFLNESDQPNKINISHMMGTNIKKE